MTKQFILKADSNEHEKEQITNYLRNMLSKHGIESKKFQDGSIAVDKSNIRKTTIILGEVNSPKCNIENIESIIKYKKDSVFPIAYDSVTNEKKEIVCIKKINTCGKIMMFGSIKDDNSLLAFYHIYEANNKLIKSSFCVSEEDIDNHIDNSDDNSTYVFGVQKNIPPLDDCLVTDNYIKY